MPTATRRSLRFAAALAVLLLLPLTAAAAVRVRATDARGVTLELTLPAWSLSAPGADGRVRVIGVADAHSLAEPGRALLPAFAATIALPADARPSARVLAASPEESRDGVRLRIAGRPVFKQDVELGTQPAEDSVAAVLDGAWPPSAVQMTEPYSVRGRRLIALEVRPFRYDAGAHFRFLPHFGLGGGNRCGFGA